MNDFWTKKRQELQENGMLYTPKPSVTAHKGPWWQEPREDTTQPEIASHRPSQGRTEALGERCPHCGSGDYTKPSPSIAARCFDCGYVHGRQLNEPNLPGITSDAPRIQTKQLESGGHFGRSLAEINENNAVLEQSAQGRTRLT